jgi:spermidine synthase/Tfp pilus assembly protein PilF
VIAVVMAASVVVLAFAHPRFKTKLLFAGWGPYAGGYYVSRMGGSTVDVTARYMQRNLYHKEGVTASVDVLETGWGEKIISINAKPVATTYVYDMRALKMLGHLPVLLHPQPQDVLIIGLGAGVSSGIIASYQAVQDVTVVELCEEVPGGAAQFEDWNHDVIHNPKVKIVINDGANYVKATRKQYDVISADPIHPFVSGAGTLYSAEHWSICKDRLREGGILAQWLPLYQLSVDDFATIVRTFVEVFPSASMWFSGIDTVLVGSKGPFKIDPDRLAEHMSAPAVIADLLSMGVHQPADVLGWFAAGPPELRAAGGDAAINSVNLPILEFSAPKSVGRRGVGSTVPALLAANEKLAQHEFQRRLNDMCTRPLDSQALRSASIAREAWRWLMRAQLLYSYDYPNQCLDAIARSYELRPNDRFIRRALAEAWYGVGDQQRDDGYLWDALRAFREAMAKDPHNANALTSSVETALELNHVDLADSILLLATPEQRKIFQVLISSGMVALRRSDYEVARKAFEEASSRGQESPRMHVGLGIVRLREGQSDSANGHFERAIQISTSPVYTLYDIVNLCTGHGFSAAARQYAEQLLAPASACIAADPGRPLFYEYRALAYSALGDKKNAAQDRATARSLADWWEGSAAAGSAQSPPEI